MYLVVLDSRLPGSFLKKVLEAISSGISSTFSVSELNEPSLKHVLEMEHSKMVKQIFPQAHLVCYKGLSKSTKPMTHRIICSRFPHGGLAVLRQEVRQNSPNRPKMGRRNGSRK
ncbi:MAG: hypothetical protein WCT07_00950 [Candidatus Paceibacterota bacterium]|jgi:hypothetical protein